MMLPMALDSVHLLWTPMMRKATLICRRQSGNATISAQYWDTSTMAAPARPQAALTTGGDARYGCRQMFIFDGESRGDCYARPPMG